MVGFTPRCRPMFWEFVCVPNADAGPGQFRSAGVSHLGHMV